MHRRRREAEAATGGTGAMPLSERLVRRREQHRPGRTFSDSTDMLREWREESPPERTR